MPEFVPKFLLQSSIDSLKMAIISQEMIQGLVTYFGPYCMYTDKTELHVIIIMMMMMMMMIIIIIIVIIKIIIIIIIIINT